MLKKILFTAQSIFAAIFILVLNACVYGVPIVSPVDVVFIAGMGAGSTSENIEQYWPFEREQAVLELKCEGLSVKMELSSHTALVTMPDRELQFTRSVGADERQRLAYWDAIRIEVDDIGILASEDGQGLTDFHFNKLIVLDAHSAELDLYSGLLQCRVE